MRILLSTVGAALVSVTFGVLPVPVSRDAPYPEGYRHWTHVRSGMIGPNNPGFAAFGGLHHIYANEAAMRGYASGAFPDGATLVFDRFEAITSTDDVTTEGARQVIDVMRKDSAAFPATGGWGFDEFRGSSRVRTDASRAACARCHSTQRGHDFVFSTYVE